MPSQQRASSSRGPSSQALRIAFVHPDLGLGGAERLIVDAATVLVQEGHEVDVYTAYYDPDRCFQETKTGGFTVNVAGGWFPRHVLGRMIALCAYIRCIIAAFVIVWRSWSYRATCIKAGKQPFYDVIIADQVSAVVPFLRYLTSSKVLFYCHFPDLLLAQGRGSLLKRIYRAPLDALEERTTGMADLILVNSNYTKGIFGKTFSSLAATGVEPDVLYPAVQVPSDAELSEAEGAWTSELDKDMVSFIQEAPTLLSINRFERKKGISLAIRALAAMQKSSSTVKSRSTSSSSTPTHLVVAGGYDARLAENREHLEELKQLAHSLGLQNQVKFLPSFTDRQRSLLLAACCAVLYTPQNEHFGIVPLEAMASGRPVIACSSGGPLETVVHGTTGMLCAADPEEWASAISRLLEPGMAQSMGQAARRHVQARFSRESFGKQLNTYIRRLSAVGGAGGSAMKKSRRSR